jgi:hypothetical protein
MSGLTSIGEDHASGGRATRPALDCTVILMRAGALARVPCGEKHKNRKTKNPNQAPLMTKAEFDQVILTNKEIAEARHLWNRGSSHGIRGTSKSVRGNQG